VQLVLCVVDMHGNSYPPVPIPGGINCYASWKLCFCVVLGGGGGDGDSRIVFVL
jgi:hypothetical protein